MNAKIINALKYTIIALIAAFILIQLIPYGRQHTNPPVVQEPAWDAETRALAQRACFDCHSNETVWPWYSNVAPVSWLVQHDVEEGRQHLNFSEWKDNSHAVHEVEEVISEGEMPPGFYIPLHPDAALTAEENRQLIEGLKASIE